MRKKRRKERSERSSVLLVHLAGSNSPWSCGGHARNNASEKSNFPPKFGWGRREREKGEEGRIASGRGDGGKRNRFYSNIPTMHKISTKKKEKKHFLTSELSELKWSETRIFNIFKSIFFSVVSFVFESNRPIKSKSPNQTWFFSFSRFYDNLIFAWQKRKAKWKKKNRTFSLSINW